MIHEVFATTEKKLRLSRGRGEVISTIHYTDIHK